MEFLDSNSFVKIILFLSTEQRTMYPELSQGIPLLGVNPNMAAVGNYPNLAAERTALGERVLASNHAPIAQEFLKRGSPRAIRGKLWSLVLGSIVKDNVPKTCIYYLFLSSTKKRFIKSIHMLAIFFSSQDEEYYEELKSLVLQYDIMVDKLIIKVKLISH